MRKKTTIFLAIFFSSLSGCSTSNIASHPKPPELSLETADQIQLGKESSSDLEKTFGKTSNVFGAASFAIDSKSGLTRAFLYCEKEPCTQGHLTFGIDKKTQRVISVVWNSSPEDGIVRLDTILNHYKEMTFVKKRLLYTYGDYFDEVEKYSNLEHGIVISYDPEKKEVRSVSRIDPAAPSIEAASTKKFPIITELPERDTASSPTDK